MYDNKISFIGREIIENVYFLISLHNHLLAIEAESFFSLIIQNR